ncbi:MAG: hypothetical protein ACYC8T_30430 [Myxococcaceae bacterium]
MNRALWMGLSLVGFHLTACGHPAAQGDGCSGPNGSGLCESPNSALICESGFLRAIPCKGAEGCVVDSSSQFTCQLKPVVADNCPFLLEGVGSCDPENVDAAYLCSNGLWNSVMCKACAPDSGRITCINPVTQ